MSQIYLAGPFFSEEQIDRVSRIEKALEENKTITSFYSPRITKKAIMNYSALDGRRKYTKKIWKS